jgi:hypothetical protein
MEDPCDIPVVRIVRDRIVGTLATRPPWSRRTRALIDKITDQLGLG